MNLRSPGLVVCMAALITAGSVHAAVLDNFDGLTVGAINGQNGWTADSSSAGVGRDFTRSNDQFMILNGANNDVYKSLGASSIADGQTGTLFFRFMASSAASNHGIGVTDVNTPSSFTNYRASALIYNDTRNVKMQGSSGSSDVNLTLNGGASGIAPLTWNDAWIVVNNSSDTADFYLRRDGSEDRYLVGSGLAFRNGSTTETIDRFLARVASGTYDNVVIDDVHTWAGGVTAGDGEIPAAPATPTLDVSALLGFSGQRLDAINSWLGTTTYLSTTSTSGSWGTTGASGWTSGFYPGDLWQMYRYTGSTSYSTTAASRTAGLEGQKTNTGTHDVGFMIFNSFGQGYKMTNTSSYKDIILTTATSLSMRYSSTVGAIQSWGDRYTGAYQVIVDNMMNLEILFWASKHGGNSYLYDIAVQHALTTKAQHVRANGGTYHVVEFNRTTGAVIDKYTVQGYSDESTWSRGQAWGTYGFTMTYRETGDTRFLETATQLANYFIDHLSVAGLPYYDFDDPANPPAYDTAAATIAASGLLELMYYVDDTNRERYFNAAKNLLLKLSSPGILADGSTFQSILMQGSIGKNSYRMGTSYGDYYYLEALGRYDAAINPITWTGAASSSWNQNPSTSALNWSKSGTATYYMDLNNVVFDDTATNTAVNIDWDYVRPASMTFNNSTKDYTVQGAYPIVGFGALTKTGTGRLTLTCTNTFSGPVNFNGGAIRAAILSNLGSGAALNFNGGGLQFDGVYDPSVRTMTFQTGGATLDTQGNDITLSNAIGNSGSGGLTKLGAGKLTLNALNIYSGDTIVNAGTLEIAGGISAGGTSLIDVQAGTAILKTVNVNKLDLDVNTADLATFEVASGLHEIGSIAGDGITTIDDGATLSVDAIAQGGLYVGAGAKLVIRGVASEPLGDTFAPVPEPSTIVLLGIGALGLLISSRRRRKMAL